MRSLPPALARRAATALASTVLTVSLGTVAFETVAMPPYAGAQSAPGSDRRSPTALPPAGSTADAVWGYVHETVDPDLGLPDTHVSAIAQTPDGYLWLGTRRGLVRFDGVNATVFTPQNTSALRSWSINALMADSTGALWVSTDRGLTVRERGAFRAIDHSQVPGSTVWKVWRDRRKRVWVTGDFGVRVGDGTRFAEVPGFEEHIYAAVEDRQGRMWFGGRQVLASYTAGDSAPVRWPAATELRVYDLALDSAGSLWIGVRDGVRELDVTDRWRISERRRVSTVQQGVRAQVWSLAFGPGGSLWLGTDTRGVLRYDGRTLSEVGTSRRGRADPVWWVTRDSRGSVWAGTSGGLIRFRRSAFRTVTEGLAAVGTWAIHADRDGTPWLSADDGQVAWFDGVRWHPVFRNLVDRTAPSHWPSVSGGVLVADDEGRVWRATRNGVREISRSVAVASGALGLFEDRDGSLLLNTANGLLRSRDGLVDSLFTRLGLTADDTPRVIDRDARGRLLVANPYLTIGEGSQRRRYGPSEGLTDPAVLALHEAGGALWIATADSGLFVMRNERVQALGRANERLARGINGIVSDTHGYLWLTSRAGLLRVAVADLLRAADAPGRGVAVREFDRADGLPTTDINNDYQSQLLRQANGHIWLPTYAGPVVFDPGMVVEDSIPPQVHIETIAIDGIPAASRDSVLTDGHPGRVEIHFAATNALVPRRVRVEYRVRGISDQWIDAGRRRTITFGPLAGGEYTVDIRVAGEDGSWNPQHAVARLTVPRSLAEQSWFFPLLAATTAIAVFGFTRWRLASARLRERELSRLVRERTADLEASRAELEVRVAERTDALSRELAERYRLEQRLESSRRMASLGRLAGGVSHEINNALATVLGFAQLAQMASKPDERIHEDLAEVVRAGRRAASITHQLLAFAKQHHTALTVTSLDTVVRENLRSLGQLCAPLDVRYDGAEGVPEVNADVGQIEQLLVNLVKNARDAKPRDGRITIALDAMTLTSARAVGERVLPAGRYAVLSVSDRGTGIASATLEQLFEPFFTTKDLHEGSGLGLAVVQGIVARHDGAIEVASVVGEGTTFRTWLPERSSATPTPMTDGDVEGSGETILLAEDDASIRQFATRMLREHGYRVLDAEDGAAAIALVGKAIEAIDLVLTDVLMPNANGLELARLLRAARPELPVVFMTGYAGLDEVALQEMRATGPVLPKPFSQDTLLQAVRRALEAREQLAPTQLSGGGAVAGPVA